jgi:uncharacterized membrane protein YphA (DoxX/SURF4 family)
MSITLWILQVLLALVFLLVGGSKVVLPMDQLTQQLPLPALWVRSIGMLEVLGGVGLVLPGVLRTLVGLTPLAAAGLSVEMVVAAMFSMSVFGVGTVAMPLVLAVLCACVAYGRWRLAPHQRANPSSGPTDHRQFVA